MLFRSVICSVRSSVPTHYLDRNYMFMSGICRFNDERRIRRILDLAVERDQCTPAFSKKKDEAAPAG